MDASGVSYDQVPDNLKEAWERAVAEGKATGEVQEAIAKEAADLSAEAQAQKLVRRILDLVIVPTSRMKPEMAAKKREFVAAYFGGARLDKLTEVATSLGISKDQAKRWSAELPNFVEKYAEKLRAALDTAAAELDLTTEQVRDAMEALAGRQESQAVVAEEDTGQTTTAAEEPVESDNDQRKEPNAEDEATDEGQVDERDTTLIQRDRKSESIQEQFNATETNNAAILRTLEELEDAKEKGDDAKVDELQVKVDELIAQGTKQYEENKRRVRATAGKETKNAVQEQGAGEVDVRQEAGNGKKVGKRNAKSEKPAEQGVQTAAEKAAQAWDQVASLVPGAPRFSELSEERQQKFIAFGPQNWKASDVQKELNELAPPPPEVAKGTTAEQKRVAEEHAQELGGEVVYQNGDLALIRGYSMLSGNPVYAGAKGEMRTSGNIERFKGDLFTAEEKAELVKAMQEAEAKAAELHKSDPFIKFDGDGVAVSQSISPELSGIVAGWKKLLGLKVNVYITTIEDARDNRNRFTGPHRAVGSAALDSNESGSMRRLSDGSYYVAFTKSTSMTRMLETLAHELGHVHEREAFKNASEAEQIAIIDEFNKWKQAQIGKTAKESIQSLRARNTGRRTNVREGMMADELTPYWRSFGEWYADQVSRWAVSSEKPVSVVEKFFSRLAAALKRFYYSLKGQKYLPNETMKNFLDRIAEGTLVIESKVVDADPRSEKMFAGVESLDNISETERDELSGKLAQAIMLNSLAKKDKSIDGQSIWEDTGWAQGVDGKWRYWVSDDNAKLKDIWESFPTDQSIPLVDVLDHPELFRRYPALEYFYVVRDTNVEPGGGVQRGTVLHVGAEQNFDLGFAHSPLGILLHEIQHGVQDIEGFSPGGSVRTVDPMNPKALRKVIMQLSESGPRWTHLARGLERYLLKIEAAYADVEAAEENVAIQGVILAETGTPIAQIRKNPKYQAAGKRLQAANERLRKVADGMFANSGLNEVEIREMMYLQIAGEVEARETAERFNNPSLRLWNPNAQYPRRVQLQVGYSGVAESRVTSLTKQMPEPIQKKADYVSTNLREAGRKGVLAAAITEDVVDMAKKYMESATDYLKAQYARQKTRLEFELRIERILSSFDKLNDATKKAVNEFIADSTKEGVWGYAPSYNPNVKIDDAMKARFEAMPAAAQRVIQDTFDHGYQALQLKQKAVKDAANREFAERIKAANGNQQELNEIRLDKMAFENKFNRLLNIKNDKPYAYMGRYGDYVVVAKSAEYLEAEKLAREGDTAAAEWLTEHQADGDHYFVAFGETQGDVDQIKAQLDASGMYERTYAAQKLDKGAYTGGDDLFLAVTRLSRMLARKAKNDITGSLDGDSLKSLNKMIGDLYLATVAEASAHTASLQRKNVAGFDRDMMRNLATRGRADAHFLASLEHNEKITDTIEAMIDESENDPGRARPYLNELLKRHANSMDYKTPSPLATTLTRMSNIWFLATSPAFYLQQILQTAVLSQPYLSGRLGYFRSMRAIKKAYADVAPLVKGLGLNDHVDFSKAPEDVRTMLNELVGMGKIDLGIDSDAKARAGDQGVLAKAMYKLQGVNTRIETINRAAAAIAAYRGYLDRYKNGDRAAATKFAAEVVSNTHGSYDGFNTPRLLSTDTGRVLFQFKRFQIIQLSMLMKLMSNAFKGASKEERAIARRALAFIGGHMAVLGGALGVPFVSQIAWAMSKLFGDPDEPDDFEFKLRRMIGDESMANLLLKGVPAFLGVDLSGKLAMQNVASVLPFNEGDISSRSGMEKTLVAMMGPSAALSLKFADALGLMSKGDYYKGLEQALPSGMANALKGARFATEGVTMRNGDLVLPAEDVSLFDAAFQAVGLPTDTLTGRQRLQNYKAEFDDFYNTRTSELKQQYTKAAREGDSTTMAEAREEWKQLQESRARNGYTRQPLSTLLKAPNEAAKRARNNIDGVQFNKQSVGFGRQFSNI